MAKRLFLCLLILVVADGRQHHQNDFKRVPRIFGRSVRPRLPFSSWNQYRIDPWFLRWPGLWRLGTQRNDLNIASVKRRRRWTKYRTRRSKWSKLYSKQDEFNKISKQTPVHPWINQKSAPLSAKEFSKTLESASYYATPTWLKRLRKDLNREQNKVDALHSTFTSNLSHERYPKVTSLRWNERSDQKSAVFRQTVLPPKPAFNSPLFENENLLGSFPGNGHDYKTQAEFPRPLHNPTQGSSSLSHEVVKTAAIDHGLPQYSSDVEDAFYPSGDASDDIKTSESHHEYDRDDLFSLTNGKMETRQLNTNLNDKMDGQLMAEGQMVGSSGESFPDFASNHKISSGSSFGHIDDPMKPDERSGNPPLDDGFGLYDTFPDEDYLAYMDFDESGFGSMGGFGSHDDGSFLNEDDNCEGIDSRSCTLDSDCNCMGMYFCVKGACSTISTSSDDSGMPAEMKGIWGEAPMAE